jgi:hypothetical protein
VATSRIASLAGHLPSTGSPERRGPYQVARRRQLDELSRTIHA